MEYKDFAINLAKQAGKVMQTNFTLAMKKEWKSDRTPLTVTDTVINQMVMDAVSHNYPDYSFIGEEGSFSVDGSTFTWVCDPVDGTIPFSHGIPTAVFSLALVNSEGEPIVGVLYDPFMDRLLFAEKGKGAFLNDSPISVSKASSFGDVMIDMEYSMKMHDLSEVQREINNQYGKIIKFNSIAYAGALVACGELAAAIFPYNKPWDGAAVKIIVEEAGGKVTNLYGEEQRWDTEINGYIASNRLLHEQIIDLIKKYYPKS